jgi:sec-independent protein translocase protein TatA
MANIGAGQLIIIILLLLVVFGANRFPNIMKSLAEGVNEFRKGVKDGGKKPAPKPAAKKPVAKKRKK